MALIEGEILMPIRTNCPDCGQKLEVDESQAGLTQACSACGEPVTMPGVKNFFPGSQVSDRFQFSLRNMLGFVTVICVLLAFLLPAIQASREAARRTQCINNLKNYGLAMYTHHDVHGRLPLISSEPRTGRPGIGTGPNPAGFSWIVGLLPYWCEIRLHGEIVDATDNRRIPPFHPAGKPEISCTQLQILHCPSSIGSERVDIANSEYQEYMMPQEMLAPARSNYVAFAASHFTNSKGFGQLSEAGQQREGISGSGLMTFPTGSGSNVNKGANLKWATDGTSKTLLLAETNEQAYSAWIDGQATWVIAAWQGDSPVPSRSGASDGFLGWSESDTSGCTSLGIGSRVPGGQVYLTAERYGAGHDRVWGPSSEHTGGTVNHLFADGHVVSIVGSAIEPNTYLRLINYDGGEPISIEAD